MIEVTVMVTDFVQADSGRRITGIAVTVSRRGGGVDGQDSKESLRLMAATPTLEML